MNPAFILNIIITVVLAIIIYFTLPLVLSDITSHSSAAIGVLLGGLLVAPLASLLGSRVKGAGSDDASDEISTLYVGNLSYKANEQAVKEHFEQQGVVNSVRLMKDRRTGKRKGYGFVEMNAKGANKAIKNLNDSIFQERTLKVRLAKDKIEEE
jgi:hypothetical protein